jgi:RHS repeat-associated protein
LFTGQREMVGLVIYHYNARFYSPYINQFLSADTIVPNPPNPQDLNRFSYVRNNPLKYTDPTGHACVEGTSYCVHSATGQSSGHLSSFTGIGDAAPLSQKQYCDRYPWACGGNTNNEGGGNGGAAATPTSRPTITPDITSPILPTSMAMLTGSLLSPPTPIGNYCGNNGFLACTATFTQDVATLIDLVGAGMETALIVDGCFAGGLAGCGTGLLAGITLFNVSGLNLAESGFSGTSLVFTVLADAAEDGELGESSSTSFVTFLAGGMSPDPILDLAIDGYASGYNHEIFNGFHTIINGGGLFQP